MPIQAHLLYRTFTLLFKVWCGINVHTASNLIYEFTLPHIYIYLKYGAGLSSISAIYLPVIYLQAIYFMN